MLCRSIGFGFNQTSEFGWYVQGQLFCQIGGIIQVFLFQYLGQDVA